VLVSSGLEWFDWLPRSLHCAAANWAAAPGRDDRVLDPWRGGGGVSERRTGVKMMQEWEFVAGRKASVYSEDWGDGLASVMQSGEEVSELQALRSDG
jgi:hypothetical protein